MFQLKLIWKLFTGNRSEVTPEEISYFRDHPDEIDDLTAKTNLHVVFLAFGFLLGMGFVGLSKLLKYETWLATLGDGWREFLVDIVFEIGVALIGAGVTAYLLVILFRAQQKSVLEWRRNIRNAIAEAESEQKPTVPK